MGEELKEQIAKWVLDGGLTCITCQPDDGGNFECEQDEQGKRGTCESLKDDIGKLLALIKESQGEPPVFSDAEIILRRLLWRHHGCPSQYLYGDDGELQCSNPKHDFPPFTDFKRDSARLLEWKLSNNWCKSICKRPEK